MPDPRAHPAIDGGEGREDHRDGLERRVTGTSCRRCRMAPTIILPSPGQAKTSSTVAALPIRPTAQIPETETMGMSAERGPDGVLGEDVQRRRAGEPGDRRGHDDAEGERGRTSCLSRPRRSSRLPPPIAGSRAILIGKRRTRRMPRYEAGTERPVRDRTRPAASATRLRETAPSQASSNAYLLQASKKPAGSHL